MMADRVKGLGHVPSPGWAESTIMKECTTESGHCKYICTFSSVALKVVTNEKGEAVGEVLTIIC
jgi:hypothetical protein